MNTAKQRKTKPLAEQPIGDKKVGGDTGASLLNRLYNHLRTLLCFSVDDEPQPGAYYADYVEQEFQGELLLVIPPNMKPTTLVISGYWEDSFPEVKLTQSAQQQTKKRHAESSHNMADGDSLYASFRDHRE